MKRFADARETVPAPQVIACVEMKPFCLGHHLLFKLLNLPFAGNADADFGANDLVLGIAICGNSYEETLAAIHHGDWPDIIARWRKRAGGPWWNPRFLDMNAEEVKFREYLADGYRMPPMWRHEGQSIEMSAPWENLLKVRLVMAGFSESEVLNGYLPGRWYDYFSAIEIQEAASCTNHKYWRKIFFTQKDAELIK